MFMEKITLENLVNDGLSTTEIGKKIGLSQTCTRYWLKKHQLKTIPLHNLENRFKYSDSKLMEIWRDSDSVNQFLLKLGVGTSGGAWYHYKKRLQNLGVDFSNSTINGRIRGGQITAELMNRKSVLKRVRLPRPVLKKSMELHNIEYKCKDCNIFEWKEKKIKLHIHHKDGNKKNNVIDNLEYLCPNCHSVKHFKED